MHCCKCIVDSILLTSLVGPEPRPNENDWYTDVKADLDEFGLAMEDDVIM